jgi:diguanylate cyclase (GGDEF)-like protein
VNARTWKAWLIPGGLLLALVTLLVNSSLFAQVAPSLAFYYFAVFAAGLLLAWRFNSSRVLFSLLVLLLAHRAVDFFSSGQIRTGPGRMAAVLAALLVPLNFVALAVMRERGLVIAGIAPRFVLLFLESVVFAVACRPENSPSNPQHGVLAVAPAIPVWALAGFVAAIAWFVWRYFQTRKPIEPGFVWSVAAVFLWLQFAPIGKTSDAYVATAALILGASMIETSYMLAYHDELTGIRGRRAFNESLLSLDEQYAIAIVDIDHFKKFNDTYGHDVGDQVLCMVAARLSDVAGNGQAFRCGGEEFAIVFRDVSARDAFEHLEALRKVIEKSAFHVRGADRRAETKREIQPEIQGELWSEDDKNHNDQKLHLRKKDLRTGQTDRRRSSKKKTVSASLSASNSLPDHLSVTVSIGVAEPGTRNRQPEQVIQAADQALYRAKHRGRNRVEPVSTAPLHLAETKRAKASQR